MGKTSYTVKEILAQFDQQGAWYQSEPASTLGEWEDLLARPEGEERAAKWLQAGSQFEFLFPSLDLNVDLGTVRFTAWRDDTRWAVVVETVVFNMRGCGHGGITNCLHWFGNCVQPAADGGNTNLHFICVTQDGPEGPTFRDGEHWNIRRAARSIRIRGRVVPIDLRAKSLRARDIDPGPDENGLRPRGGTLLLRSLLPEHRGSLLAAEEELHTLVPTDLPLFLRLDEWHHPDTTAGEAPGESETFRMLADAIVAGDRALYHPTEPPNTHWSNWKQVIV